MLFNHHIILNNDVLQSHNIE